MQRARVIAEHRSADRPSIRVSAGDSVTLGERDSDWPQFVWATLAQGLGGWIPAALFDRDTGMATALGDYDTRETTIRVNWRPRSANPSTSTTNRKVGGGRKTRGAKAAGYRPAPSS